MIKDHEKENSRDILFGHGTVMIHRCHFADEAPERVRVVMLRENRDGHAVGERLSDDDPSIGVPSNAEPEKPTVKLIFDNLAGLDALMAELNLLRDDMLTPSRE